ncbi:MAG TPA: undecaprenyl-diphosphate phosphatase [Candidatus Bathyarchaeia archaeon]|nr:undecaprenyl-diphosphate phosphatase [Candidatus Bathyarchaeia archaeon]
MDLIQTIILGLIQGLTEWLPISSTGHLRLTEHFFDLNVPILFDVLLHGGTLIVTLLFFHKDVKNIFVALAKWDFKTENGKLIPLIIVGTIPTALIGLIFGNAIEALFSNLLPIAGAFIICGVALYSSKIGNERKESISYVEALAIGTAQGIAIIPGISRSGLTIAVALLLGTKREKAFKFSFLLSVPAIIGALGLTLYEQHEALALAGVGWTEILVGVAVSTVVGYFALNLLRKIVAHKKFYFFAFYCWLLSVVLIALSLSGF